MSTCTIRGFSAVIFEKAGIGIHVTFDCMERMDCRLGTSGMTTSVCPVLAVCVSAVRDISSQLCDRIVIF